MASAFRLAYTRIILIGATAAANTENALKLEAKVYAFNDGDTTTNRSANLSFVWEVLMTGAWEAVAVHTTGEEHRYSNTTAGDAGKSFRCKVTYQDDDGAASVVYTNVITLAGAE